MFCIFNNIFICSVNELPLLNLNNFNFIINCSNKLSNLINNQNFLNLNIDQLSIENFNEVYNFILKNINQKIIILDETGKDISMILGMFIVMKYYNVNFDLVYDNIKIYTDLYNKEYYSFLYNYKKIYKMEIE